MDLIARREEVLGFGFWIARRGKVLQVLVARQGEVLVARRGKVLLVLVARREEGSGCGGSHSLYVRVRCCFPCMFLLHATTCFLREKLLRLAGRKDGSPMGVVWRGGAQIACSDKRNRLKLQLVIVSHCRP